MKHSYQDALVFYELEGAHPGGFELTKSILKNEDIHKNDKILEAGCGLGQTSQYLAETYGCQVYAMDNHPEMVNKTTKRLQQVQLPVNVFMGSIEKMPFPKYFFDFIIAESSTSFTTIQKSIREYYRVLKPGGTLISIDMTAECILPGEHKEEIMNFYQLKTLLTQSEWISAFEKEGFSHLEILKSNTVIEELENAQAEHVKPLPSNEAYSRILEEHYRLTLTYGNSLGYRVFRMNK
ncbi:class I SAM-dependent methyltransferase [Peribacillus sp. NPDC097284]|uniref:class I SAM-dependent methyltransferase n=1 Tax=Peribacillus sp. NPDC097284 TaxID=3364401 RepID=UPI00382A9A10